MVADIDGFLPDSAFLLDVPATDWKDAIRLAGKGLVAAGFTTDAYTDQMIETVEKMGPYIVIAPGLALAHSRPSEAVLKTGLCWVRLSTPVKTGVEVTEIAQVNDQMVVVARDGRRWRAAHVVVAIPPGPLGRIRISPEPPAQQRRAWAERHLTAVTAVHVKPLRPYWEQDGLPLNLWLDGSIERMFGIPGPDGKIQRAIIWINGAGAQAIDQMDEGEIGRWALAELARVRPAAAGANQVLGVRSWGRDPWTMGAFAEIAPGRCASTAEWTARPHGRIHFAGEHTGFDHPGVEAALASGVRAVVEISDSITRPGT